MLDDDADAIVEAMVHLARALKMQVTAEGVETAEQRDMALAIGCDELQGFLLGFADDRGADARNPVHGRQEALATVGGLRRGAER